jgi:glycopeptide antibiotics resistance protein
LVFCNLFEFSAAEITSKSITPTFWIQILPNKFHYMPLIKIFPTTLKAHSNSFKIFSYDLI